METANEKNSWLEDWKQVFEQMDVAVIMANRYGKVLFCNEEYIKVCKYDSIGVTAQNIIGQNMEEILKKANLEKSQSALLLCMEQRKKVCTIFQAPLYKVVMSTGVPVFDENGDIKFAYTLVRDEREIFRLSETSQYVREMYAEYLKKNEKKLEERPIIVSDLMQRIVDKCLLVSHSDISVLVMGESGVGKDVISRFVHENSSRRDKPFLAINCGAIPENLIESELFGYVPGAFTGASKNGKMGIFEAANNGTVMLDEIGDLPLHVQVKLLRVLENHQVTRIGAVKPTRVDFRLISATNKNLPERVRTGEFREDLYYRINSFRVMIPPLRERIEDVTALASHYLSIYNLKYKRDRWLLADAMKELTYYKWPGNIRELRNVMEQLVVLGSDEGINAELVRSILYGEGKDGGDEAAVVVRHLVPLKEAVAMTEIQILEMVKRMEGSSYKAAHILKVDQTTVLRKMKKYKLDGFQSD